MNQYKESIGLRIVALLVIVGFTSSFVLWTLDTTSTAGESLFGLYLSIDLIAFAMMAYIYNSTKFGDEIGRWPLLVGAVVLLLLLAATFAV